MIRSYVNEDHVLREGDAPEDALWVDLVAPGPGEADEIGARLGVELPTREEMAEIEVSSRLYSEDGAIFLTALVPAQAGQGATEIAPVSFVLSRGRLVTLRDHAPRAFETFARRAAKTPLGCTDGEAVLVALLDAVVDRVADILEQVAQEVDALSRRVFDGEDRSSARFQEALREIGRKGGFASSIRDSLVTLERAVSFLSSHTAANPALARHRDDLASLAADIRALSDHADFLGQKINFLLDATLGLISIEQNRIMQLFSVVAVVFLPPTLVASIYGMNFEVMPELSWPWGYPAALGLIVASAVLPYLWFRRRGWL